MDLTHLQKERINRILQHELAIMAKGIEEVYRLETSPYRKNNRKVLRFNNTVKKFLVKMRILKFSEVSIDFVQKKKKGPIIGKASHNIFELIESELVHNSNRELSQFRGTVRKMRRWFKLPIGNYILDDAHVNNHTKGFLEGYDYGIDEALGISKKILKGHEIKMYFQTKSCVKCGLPIAKEDRRSTVRRGILCEECLPIEPKLEFIKS